MNARRRKTNLGMPSRVYERGGSWYWVRPSDQKWIRLCRVDDGQRTMLKRLGRPVSTNTRTDSLLVRVPPLYNRDAIRVLLDKTP